MSDNKNIFFHQALFGIPFNNTDLLSLVAKCMDLIKNNKLAGKTSYLTWVDGKLAAKCHGWLPSTVEDLELLTLLRNAQISCISGSFLNTLGKLLGSSMAPAISQQDFLINLFRALGENEKGVFFLSNQEKEAKNAALGLHDKFTKVRLVGIAAPPIYTEGKNLITAGERDALLIEQINASNADVLIIDLGYPKQLLWLDRVSQKLQPPLIITFEENVLTNQTKDFRQKVVNFFQWMKLVSLSVPLVCFHTLNRCVSSLFSKKNQNLLNSRLFLSEHRTIASIDLPEGIDRSTLSELHRTFDEVKNHDVLILNFRNVRHIQPGGFYFLIKTWQNRIEQNKEIYGYSLPGDIVWLMKVHQCWNLLKNRVCNSPEVLMSRLKGPAQMIFYDAFQQESNKVTISFLGSLNKHLNFASYLQKIIPIVDLKKCSVDFGYCTYIDNSGFAFLLDLQKYLYAQNGTLTLLSVNTNLYKQFKNVKLDKSFVFKKK